MNRIHKINNELTPHLKMSIGIPNQPLPDDVVIISALRTPHTKAAKGLLKDTAPEILLAHVLRETIKQTYVDPLLIGDIIVGNVLQPSAGVFPARMAQFLADLPLKVPISVVNRFCASGLEACALIAAKIKAGFIDIGIGAGVESMSFYEMKNLTANYKFGSQALAHPLACKCLIPMGQTSDNICKQFGLTQQELDTFAVNSHKKADFATKNGFFKHELVPISTTFVDKNNKPQTVIVTQDGDIRDQASLESLSKLKPVFTQNGLTTSGNSSQMTDGASAVLLTRRSFANKLGLKIIGKFISHSVVGVPPEIMGVGPAEAIPLALKAAGLDKDQIDIFEINEAFASVAVLTIKKLGLDPLKVNPNGGAIAFGHPLGSTGSRQFATLLAELKRTNKKYGVISMCLGTGMGAAAVIERE